MKIVPTNSPLEIEHARQLFKEYAADSRVDLCFQNFEEELRTLPGYYAPPDGRLFLALSGPEPVGCIALRKSSDDSGELKRLYVKPAFRGKDIGRMLTEAIITQAREIGYRKLRLDTLGRMEAAVALYEAFGFRRISSYRFNPEADAIFMELDL